MILKYKGQLFKRVDAMDPNVEFFNKHATEIASKLKEAFMQSGYEINKYKAVANKSGRNSGINVSFVSNPEQGVISGHIPASNNSYGTGGGLVKFGEMGDMHKIVEAFINEKSPHAFLKKGEKHEHSHLNFDLINDIEHAIQTISRESTNINHFCASSIREAMKEGDAKTIAKEKKLIISAFKILDKNCKALESKVYKL